MNEYDSDDVEALLAAELTAFDPTSHGGSSEPIGVHAVDWRRLSDADAPDEWTQLRAWVEWFTVRYSVPISTVPNCWWRHGALVEELSALHVAHLAAFDDSDGGFGPIGWHERLAIAMPRLTRVGSGCTSEHHSIRPRSWSSVTDETEWAAWISQNHAR